MKAKVFFLFGIGTLLLLVLKIGFFDDFLFKTVRGSFLTQNIELIFNTLVFFPIVLFFSIITYRPPERVFITWWNFARILVPAILIGSIVVNLGYFHNDGGVLAMNDSVDQVFLVGMYSVFSLGSIIQIIRGYKQK